MTGKGGKSCGVANLFMRKCSRKKKEKNLREGKISLREIARTTNFGKPNLSRLHKHLYENDEAALAKILSPSLYKAGKTTMLTNEEKTMVVERLIFAAKRAFAADKDSLKSLMTRIASHRRQVWKLSNL